MNHHRNALGQALEAVRDHAPDVDANGAFPTESLEALRASGLLGLTLPEDVGGMGAGPIEFAEVVSGLAGACGSTSLVYLMHVSAAMCLLAAPPPGLPGLLERLASGEELGTLAFSEAGSRSHFWAPVSRAVRNGGGVHIAATKSWVTSASHASIHVVSTLSPGNGVSSGVDLYAVPAATPGLSVGGTWAGMGMRGNDSSPMAVDVNIPDELRLGGPGDGFGLMMETVLPWFNLGSAAVSVGLAAAASEAAIAHATAARFQHTGDALADLPTIRARLARMRIAVDTQRAYVRAVAESVAAPDDATMLHVLAVKAGANDAVLTITDEAMRVTGGAAFSRHLAVDRYFRDARAGHVMAPTADALYDFYGRAITGRELFS